MARGYSGHSELGKEGDLADARIVPVFHAALACLTTEPTCHCQHFKELVLVDLSASVLIKRLQAKQESRASS